MLVRSFAKRGLIIDYCTPNTAEFRIIGGEPDLGSGQVVRPEAGVLVAVPEEFALLVSDVKFKVGRERYGSEREIFWLFIPPDENIHNSRLVYGFMML